MFESRGSREAGGGQASGEAGPSQPAAAHQTEDGGGGTSGDAPGPSGSRETEDERIPVTAELVGPPSLEEDNRSVPQLLADLQRLADARVLQIRMMRVIDACMKGLFGVLPFVCLGL